MKKFKIMAVSIPALLLVAGLLFIGCPQRVKEDPEPPNNELANKGLAAHETFEAYKTGMPKEELYKVLNENIKKYNVNTDVYSYDSAMEKFFAFWEYFIAPKEKAGWKVSQEGWINGVLDGEHFVGALDLMISDENHIEIFDYKTSKTAKADNYKNQMILYAYLEGKQRNWSLKEIADKVTVRLFFPLIEDLEKKTVEQNMLRGVKELSFTENDIKDVIENYFEKNISTIKSIDFSKVKGNITHACSWCPYCGAKANDNGFEGCQITVAAGFASPDEVTFIRS